MKEIGQFLKKEREKRQISLRKIADETKIPIRYLEAIEEGEGQIIPGEVYLKGFLRSYAEEIGLDGDQVLERYRQITQKDEEQQPDLRRSAVRKKKVSWHLRYERAFVFVLILVLLVVAIIAAFRVRGTKKEQQLPPHQVHEKTTPEAEPELEPAPEAEARDLEIFARDKCWVEAYSQGKRLFALLLEPGETKQITVHNDLALLLGKPSVVRLKYGEEEVQGLGKETVTVVFHNDGNYHIYRGRREEEFSR